MSSRDWWRWPAARGNNYEPWFVIAWRLAWLPTLILGLLLCYVSLAMARGKGQADNWWDHAS